MKLTKAKLIKLIKEEVSSHLSEEQEHHSLDAYWSGTSEEGIVTTKDGHKITVRATTNVEDLKKIVKKYKYNIQNDNPKVLSKSLNLLLIQNQTHLYFDFDKQGI